MTENKGFDWFKLFIVIISSVFAVTIIFLTVSFKSVSTWANYQNICIQNESMKSPVEWSVRKCNGRSKVYQVK
tara:strand:- start:499 stop:717 length:219 start_codon:yes stop_codon:yes gene_type:complete